MVQNYMIAQAKNIIDLTVKVNALIGMGWQPLGGITTAVTPENVHMFYQALWTDMKNL